MALEDFDGAVAVITGGASGIGLATAQALYAQGVHVVLADINEQALHAAAEKVRERAPDSAKRIVTVAVDVTDETQVRALMRQALDPTGRLDLVVACAGIGRGGPIDDFSVAAMRQMMDVNFM